MDGKFEYAMRLETHFGDTVWAEMLLNANHCVMAVEEDQIQRVKHTEGMDSVRRNNPKSIPAADPAPGSAEQAHKPAEEAVGHFGVRGY